MQNVVMQFSPDPFKGKASTLTVSGDIDEDISAGDLRIDLDINVLGGILKEVVNSTIPFTLSDTAKRGKGPLKLVVGPFKIPSVPLISLVNLIGKIQIHNPKSERVLCAQLNMKLGAEGPLEEPASSSTTPNDDPVTICSGPNAHLKNLNWTDDGKIFTLTGNMDEDVSNLDVGLDLTVKAGIKFPPLKFNIPVAISPAIKEGPLKVTLGPESNSAGSLVADLDPISVDGKITINDGNKEEIACIDIAPTAATSVVV
jgi:hypothetical protein